MKRIRQYIVHGHNDRPDGRKDSFWTRTNLTRREARDLVREQRESGGSARLVKTSDG